MKKSIFTLASIVASTFSVFANTEEVISISAKSKEDATECCGSRKTSGTFGTPSYMVFTAVRCASGSTSLYARAAACALADADTTNAQLRATTKLILEITQPTP